MQYSKEWILERVKVYDNGQLFFNDKPIVTVYNEDEQNLVVDDLHKALNNPRFVNTNNPIDAVEKVKVMHNQRKILNKSPYEQYKSRIDNSKYLFYKTSKKCSGLSFTDSFNDIFFPITANRLLDICSDLCNGRDEEYINQQYRETMDDNFGLLIYAWENGKLNKPIYHICNRSHQVGGYIDHFAGNTLRNREATPCIKKIEYFNSKDS